MDMDLILNERQASNIIRKNDYRGDDEKDYARLVHSSAFRRLQGKTQVLGLGESDFYRTRLTHSMEVAQIGVSIKKFLKSKYRDDHVVCGVLPSTMLIKTICLAHDIGHPPFGHGGEVALNHCMRSYGGFEGNGQTLRILAKLDKYSNGYGINPTKRLLLGVLKYPVNYSRLVNEDFYQLSKIESGDERMPSWLFISEYGKPPKCYLDSELSLVEDFVLGFLTPEQKSVFCAIKDNFEGNQRKHSKPVNKSLDTSIMELADDISYAVHDLEDAIALRMIMREHWDEFFETRKEGGSLLKTIFQVEEDLDFDRLTNQLYGSSGEDRKKAIGTIVHSLITNISVKDLSGEHEVLPDILRYNAVMDSDYKKILDALKQIVVERVIKDPNVQHLEFKGQKMIVELFNVLASDPKRFLPEATLKKYNNMDSEHERKRIICDFVAGMTDAYAARLYEKIFVPNHGSIFARL